MKDYCRKILLLIGHIIPCGKHHQALRGDWRKVWVPRYLLILCSTCLSRLNPRTSLLIDFSGPSRTNLISPQFPVYKIRVKILLNYSNCFCALLWQLKKCYHHGYQTRLFYLSGVFNTWLVLKWSYKKFNEVMFGYNADIFPLATN